MRRDILQLWFKVLKMKVLVVCPSKKGPTRQLAEMIASGAKDAQAQVELHAPSAGLDPSAYDLVFVGSGVYLLHADPSVKKFSCHPSLKGKKIAFFATSARGGKKALEFLVKSATDAGEIPSGTLSITI